MMKTLGIFGAMLALAVFPAAFGQSIGQDLIVEVAGERAEGFRAQSIEVGGIAFAVTPVFENQFGRDFVGRRNWFLLKPDRRVEGSAWDLAHHVVKNQRDVVYAEPESVQIRRYYTEQGMDVSTFADSGYDSFWPHPAEKVFAWHLDDSHSQLKSAREAVPISGKRIRIGHFDTGYDPGHVSFPQNVRADLQKNVVDGEDPNSAVDPGSDGLGEQPGHGTATLSILAGNKAQLPGADDSDYVGGAPFMEIVPVRVSRTVILLQTSDFVRALYHAMSPEVSCDVVSMSMGGVASEFWADAVNDAYDRGLVIVTAAGNNFGELPTLNVVYPARFRRVIAGCGAAYDHSPYYRKDAWSGKMQGNFGPQSVMGEALAAYTPNMPWARRKTLIEFGMSGGGTSSATPQIAAACALWLQKYSGFSYEHPWQRVNAVRHALFSTADRSYPEYRKYYGNGELRALRALSVPPRLESEPVPEDEVWFPYLTLLLGWDREETAERRMLKVEMSQLAQSCAELNRILEGIDLQQGPTPEQRAQARDSVLRIPETSNSLAEAIRQIE